MEIEDTFKEKIKKIKSFCNKYSNLKKTNILLFRTLVQDEFIDFHKKYPYILYVLIENNYDNDKLNAIFNLYEKIENKELTKEEATKEFKKL